MRDEVSWAKVHRAFLWPERLAGFVCIFGYLQQFSTGNWTLCIIGGATMVTLCVADVGLQWLIMRRNRGPS